MVRVTLTGIEHEVCEADKLQIDELVVAILRSLELLKLPKERLIVCELLPASAIVTCAGNGPLSLEEVNATDDPVTVKLFEIGT